MSKKRKASEVPQEFYCPISSMIMSDPVLTCDGQTYEREEIEKWFKTKITSPVTNLPLTNATLTPCIALKNLITSFLESNPEHKNDLFVPFSKFIVACQGQEPLQPFLTKDIITRQWEDSGTALHIVCRYANFEAFEAFFNYWRLIRPQIDQDMQAENSIGLRPFDCAFKNTDYDVVCFILRKYSFPRISSFPLTIKEHMLTATENEHFDILRLLNKYSHSKFKNNCLVHACHLRNFAAVSFLVFLGADVNCKIPDEFSPIHYAARYGDMKILELLVQHGANLELETDTDTGRLWRALHFAAYNGRAEAVQFLCNKGALTTYGVIETKIKASKQFFKPLYLAAYKGHGDCVKILLKHGARVEVGDNFSSPFDAVIKNKNKNILEILLETKEPVPEELASKLVYVMYDLYKER